MDHIGIDVHKMETQICRLGPWPPGSVYTRRQAKRESITPGPHRPPTWPRLPRRPWSNPPRLTNRSLAGAVGTQPAHLFQRPSCAVARREQGRACIISLNGGRDVQNILLARQAGRLHVLSVYEHETSRVPAGLPGEMAAKLREQQTGQVDRSMAEKMEEYVGPLMSQGLPVAKILRLGSPRHLIIEVAHEVAADPLMIGSHSKRGLLDIALGGTARHVSEHAPCPVVMVAPTPKK